MTPRSLHIALGMFRSRVNVDIYSLTTYSGYVIFEAYQVRIYVGMLRAGSFSRRSQSMLTLSAIGVYLIRELNRFSIYLRTI